jgi:hypothetical protein
VAASHTYLQYIGAGSKKPDQRQRLDYPEGIRLIQGFHSILLKFACPSHAWNWPRPIRGQKPAGFDAHQTCFKCSTERFYNTSNLQAGPLYRSIVPAAANDSHRSLTGLPKASSSQAGRSNWKRVLRMRKSRVEA